MNYGYILGIVGRDSFVKGRWYSSDIEKEDTTKLASSFMHTYRVKSESSRRCAIFSSRFLLSVTIWFLVYNFNESI